VRLSSAAKNLMLDALDESAASGMKFASLHSAYSATGLNELTGGSPAYARKAAAWGAAAAGVKTTTGTIVFDVGGGSSIRFVGFWDAVTAGVFLGMTPNGGGVPQAFVVPDVTTLDVLECVAHGYNDGDAVVAWAVPGDPLPTGLVEGTIYFVINKTTDDLQLAATSGGAAINLTAIGAGTLQKVVVETFGAQGTHTLTSVTMSLD
jgi:hypothetical protein